MKALIGVNSLTDVAPSDVISEMERLAEKVLIENSVLPCGSTEGRTLGEPGSILAAHGEVSSYGEPTTRGHASPATPNHTGPRNGVARGHSEYQASPAGTVLESCCQSAKCSCGWPIYDDPNWGCTKERCCYNDHLLARTECEHGVHVNSPSPCKVCGAQ